jgi:acetylglutamate synthase
LRLPLFGVVPPRSPYTLVVATRKQEKLLENKYLELILESVILGDEYNWSSREYEQDENFEKNKEMGRIGHVVTLQAVCTRRRGIITSEVSWSEKDVYTLVTLSSVHIMGFYPSSYFYSCNSKMAQNIRLFTQIQIMQ